MRERTPRRTPMGLGMGTAPAARQGMALDTLDHLDDLEQQTSGGGIGLDQLQPQAIAQPEGFTGALTYQELATLVVAEEFLAQRADGNQTVGAGAVEGGKQAKAGDAGDAAGEGGAHMLGHEGHDIAIHGAALGGNRAASWIAMS